MTPRSREREAGLTFTEVAIVLVILGVLALAILPVLGDALEELRTRGAAEQVAAAIHQTRTYALMQACTYEMTFPSATSFAIAPSGTANNCVADSPTEGPIDVVNATAVTPPGVPIDFTSTGASIGGNVVVDPGTPRQRTVNVTVAGRVYITNP